MSVTFRASGDSGSMGPHTLILTINQARDFLHWLGLPSNELRGSVRARSLAERVRRVLHPALVDVGDEGKEPLTLSHPSGGSEFYGGRKRGALAEWASRLLRIAEGAGHRDVVWN